MARRRGCNQPASLRAFGLITPRSCLLSSGSIQRAEFGEFEIFLGVIKCIVCDSLFGEETRVQPTCQPARLRAYNTKIPRRRLLSLASIPQVVFGELDGFLGLCKCRDVAPVRPGSFHRQGKDNVRVVVNASKV